MSAIVGKIKELVAWATAFFADVKERWPWLAHLLATLTRFGDRRGSTYAAAIAFSGILALVPILMVTFSISGFVLASRPDLLQTLVDEVLSAMPGQLGQTVGEIIQTAVDSRGTVGAIGLVSAALTGIGWMGLVRTALTDMWGGRLQINAVMARVRDLGMFVTLGLAFVLTIGLTVLASGPIVKWVTETIGWHEIEGVLRYSAQLVAFVGTWGIFLVVLAKLPRQRPPFHAVLWPAMVTALVFTALKYLGGLYLTSVLNSPAGVAFGPILGIMAFAYLASQIILYATAWIAASPENAPYRTVDYTVTEEEAEHEPVYLAPVYEESTAPTARTVLTAAGLGAAAAGLYGWFRRNR